MNQDLSRVTTASAAMQQAALAYRAAGRKIGVVPTMGALHDGHLALIRRARELADVVVTTIFVNPLQFGKSEDLSRYPRNLDKDVKLATAAGSDLIFAPPENDVYPAGFSTHVEVEGVTEPLEGRSRPGHFRGVTTIVAKLLQIVQPHVAVFGQKDAQQVVVVKKMVHDLCFPVEIVIVPTVREPDGLALSSRNVYLSPSQRSEAPVLYQGSAAWRTAPSRRGAQLRCRAAEDARSDHVPFFRRDRLRLDCQRPDLAGSDGGRSGASVPAFPGGPVRIDPAH